MAEINHRLLRFERDEQSAKTMAKFEECREMKVNLNLGILTRGAGLPAQ